MAMKSPKVSPWLLYVGFIALAAFALILFVRDGSFGESQIATSIFALIGTFFGALFAFRLQESKEKAKEVKARKTALNRALLVLGMHHNEIQNYIKELSPYVSEVDRAFNLPASQPVENLDLRQKFDELDFLLESSNPNILVELIIEQQRFDQVMQAIKLRNNFYVNEVQPVFAAQGLNHRLVAREELREKLGERLFEGAITQVKMVYDHVGSSNDSLQEVFGKLRTVAKELFPSEGFVQFSPK